MSHLTARVLAMFAAIGALFVGARAVAQSEPATDPEPQAYDPELIPFEDRPEEGYTAPDRDAANVAAFLTMIALAEGTQRGPNTGYDVLFGWPAAGRTFSSSSAVNDHPRLKFSFADKKGKTDLSSAAGRYQINAPTYDDFVPKRGLTRGFTPAHQDAIATAILDRDGALSYIKAGNLSKALSIAKRRWASLPGAGYDQPERSVYEVTQAYINAGGTIA